MTHRGTPAKLAFMISSRPYRTATDNPIYHGAEIAMDELGRDHAFTWDWMVFDDGGDATKTAAYAKEIAEDRSFIGVVGPMGSTEAFAAAPLFHAAGVAQISPCASHPDLCRRAYSTFFRLVANEDAQGQALARAAYDYLKAATAAIVREDDMWAAAVSGIFRRNFEKLGGRVVSEQTYTSKHSDFSGVIQATVDAHPGLVFFAVHPGEGNVVSEGLRAAGVTVPFLGTDAMKPMFPLGGGEPSADAYHTYSGADFRHLKSAQDFRAAYVARFPEDSTYSPEAYDAIMILAAAVRRVGPDRAQVLRAVQQLRGYEGVSGPVTFDATGERTDAPVGFYRVEKRGDARVMAYFGTVEDLLAARRV
jgi:branched-chain amino acid transport system substrate-binding protein